MFLFSFLVYFSPLTNLHKQRIPPSNSPINLPLSHLPVLCIFLGHSKALSSSDIIADQKVYVILNFVSPSQTSAKVVLSS